MGLGEKGVEKSPGRGKGDCRLSCRALGPGQSALDVDQFGQAVARVRAWLIDGGGGRGRVQTPDLQLADVNAAVGAGDAADAGEAVVARQTPADLAAGSAIEVNSGRHAVQPGWRPSRFDHGGDQLFNGAEAKLAVGSSVPHADHHVHLGEVAVLNAGFNKFLGQRRTLLVVIAARHNGTPCNKEQQRGTKERHSHAS